MKSTLIKKSYHCLIQCWLLRSLCTGICFHWTLLTSLWMSLDSQQVFRIQLKSLNLVTRGYTLCIGNLYRVTKIKLEKDRNKWFEIFFHFSIKKNVLNISEIWKLQYVFGQLHFDANLFILDYSWKIKLHK